MLLIKKSHTDGGWIVYNPHNFALHTHVKHKRVAVAMKYLVEHHRLPKSTDKRFVDSMIRLTKNKRYKRQLEEYRQMLD